MRLRAARNRDFLALGAGGLSSFLTTLLSTGAARGWFTWWPDRTGFDPRSLDTDLGLYSYLRATKAYVITHPRAGFVGYACTVEDDGNGGVTIRPWDGLQRRLWLDDAGLDIAVTGAAIRLARQKPDSSLELELEPVGEAARRFGLSVRDGSGQALSIALAGSVLATGTNTVIAEGSNAGGVTTLTLARR